MADKKDKVIKIASKMQCVEISQGNLRFKIEDADQLVNTDTLIIKDPFGDDMRVPGEVKGNITVEIEPLKVKG